MPDLSVATVTGYALADAVDPCSLAVLILILIAVITERPLAKKLNRRNVLSAGISFTLAVFVTYFVFGLVIVQVFKVMEESTGFMYFLLYRMLGAAAIALGALSIKDSIHPRHSAHSNLMDDVPAILRHRVGYIAGTTTSAAAAFLFGIMVALILLPLTMGPYIITGGMLSAFDTASSIPWLVLYNIIFVLPMIAVTLIVGMEYKRVEKIAGWKGRNMRYLHLAAGLIMLCLGTGMATGLLA